MFVKRHASLPLIVLAALGSGSARGFEWQASAELGAEQHSNATKASTDEESDLNQTLGAQVGAEHKSETLELKLGYEALAERWKDDAQEDRDTVTGYTNLSWTPAQFFRAYLKNERHDLIVDSTEADVNSNSDVRDTSEAGAELSFRFTPVDRVGVTGFYRQISYQEGEGIDSERPGVLASWTHDLSPVSAVGLGAMAEEIDFDGLQSDIDRQSVFISYQAALANLKYRIEAGKTRTKLDDNSLLQLEDDEVDGELLRISADYILQTHKLQLILAHVLTDSSQGLEESSGFDGDDFNPDDTNIEDFDIVTQSQLYLNYSWGFAPSWSLGASYRFSSEDYETLLKDEDRHEIFGTLAYQVTRTVGMSVYGSAETRKYKDDTSGHDQDELYSIGVRMDWRLSKQVGVILGVEHEERTSDEPAVEYDNDFVYARLRYTFR